MAWQTLDSYLAIFATGTSVVVVVRIPGQESGRSPLVSVLVPVHHNK